MVDLTGDSDTGVICESFERQKRKMKIPVRTVRVYLSGDGLLLVGFIDHY